MRGKAFLCHFYALMLGLKFGRSSMPTLVCLNTSEKLSYFSLFVFFFFFFQWDLVCDSAWKVHIAKFSLLVGLIFGHLITGCIADW